jgi:hypothetical protein
MTELNLLYGNNLEEDSMDNYDKPAKAQHTQQIQQNQQAMQQNQQAALAQQAIIAQQSAQAISQQAQSMQMAQIESQQLNPKRKYGGYEYSFWDKMTIKRPEVIKLAIFSLVILLAIALDRMGSFYISKYLTENVLTDMQEFLLRLSYPIIIFLLLWIIKAL